MKCYLLILAPLFYATVEGKLPSNFQRCKHRENYNECLKSAIPDAMLKMANGLPELGAPPLEPLTVPSISIKGSVEQTYHDMKIYNMTTANFEAIEATISPEAFTADMTLSVPEIKVIADYNLKGTSLLVTFDGKGKSTTIFENANIKVHLIAKSFKKNNKSYYKLIDFTFTIVPNKVIFNFENLFNGNEQLTEQINKSLNENWKDIFNSLGPRYEEALATVFKAYANNIFSRIEIDELFI